MAWMWWVIAAFGLGVLEIFALDLVFANLVVAALAAAGVAALGGGFTAQVLTAAGTAALMLLLVRPLLLKRLRVQGDYQATGTAGHVGRSARVIVAVDEVDGRIKLAGEDWSARAAPGEVLAVGTVVHVTAIDGATAVVTASPSPPPPLDAPMSHPSSDPTPDTDPRRGGA